MSTVDSGAELVSELQSEADPVVQLELKNETEDELIANLLKAGEWTDEDTKLVQAAIELAQQMHQGREYKGQPYIKHPLRIANRIVRYMGIKDAATVAAAILHDVVEDHAPELVQNPSVTDPQLLQDLALGIIDARFGDQVGMNVRAVTNEPELPGQQLTYEQKLEKYAAKVMEATATFSGWAIKFSDWCENGLGIIHSELPVGSEQMQHFIRKYGGRVLEIFEYRYLQYRDQLSPEANNFVITQMTLAYQRLKLLVPHKKSS